MDIVGLLGGIRATVFAGLFVLAGLFAGWQTLALDTVRKGYDNHLLADKAATAEAERIARATESAWTAAVFRNVYDREHLRIKREATTAATIACLRDGTCQLHKRFTCPRVAQSPGSTPDSGEEAGLRPEDAEFLIRFADESDVVTDELNSCKALNAEIKRVWDQYK